MSHSGRDTRENRWGPAGGRDGALVDQRLPPPAWNLFSLCNTCRSRGPKSNNTRRYSPGRLADLLADQDRPACSPQLVEKGVCQCPGLDCRRGDCRTRARDSCAPIQLESARIGVFAPGNMRGVTIEYSRSWNSLRMLIQDQARRADSSSRSGPQLRSMLIAPRRMRPAEGVRSGPSPRETMFASVQTGCPPPARD